MIKVISSEKIDAPTESKEKKGLSDEEKIVAGFVLVVCIVAIVLILIVGGGDKKTTPAKPSIPDMSLIIKYVPFLEGYVVPVLTIKNTNEVEWKDCKITVNDKYTYRITSIPSVSYWKRLSEEIKTAKDFQITPIIWFSKSDGTKFNPETMVVRSVCISCWEPKYNVNCWEF